MYKIDLSFPTDFLTSELEPVWPHQIRPYDAQHGLLMTIKTPKSKEPEICFSYLGDPRLVAKHLLNAIMCDPKLAQALLEDLAGDPELVKGMFHDPSKN